jgi:serine/threonine protein kinase
VEPVLGESPGTSDLVLVMEYCSSSLFDMRSEMRKNYSVGTELFCTTFIPIAAALSRFHDAGFIHGDLKPDNILFRSGSSILIDFGLSCFTGTDIGRRSLYTVGFVPPEFVFLPRDAKWITTHASMDIFALGVTMLLFLQPAYLEFFSKSSQRNYRDGFSTIASLLEEMQDTELASLLAAMLDINPKKRPGAASVSTSLATMSRRYEIVTEPEPRCCTDCFEIACSLFCPLPSVRERVLYVRRADPLGVDLTQSVCDEFRQNTFQNQYNVFLENCMADADKSLGDERCDGSGGVIRPIIPDLLDEGVDEDSDSD